MVNKTSEARAKKAAQIKKVYELLGEYNQVVLVTLENVSSLQCQQIRADLRKNESHLVIGKNTVIKKAIDLRINGIDSEEDFDYLKECSNTDKIPKLTALRDLIKDKIGFIFSNKSVFELKPIVESNKVEAPAKVGIISPIDVIIPPGPTKMDPSQISFFHALSVSTKIQKGQIEITKDYQVLTAGKKIGNSEVILLQKMNLRPLSYQMNVYSCYDNGTVLSQNVLSLSPSSILDSFRVGVKNIAAISLETGYTTEASVPYVVTNAFKNLAAIGLEINYQFAQLAAASSAAPAGGSGAAAGGAAPQKQEEAEPEEEEADMDMDALFG